MAGAAYGAYKYNTVRYRRRRDARTRKDGEMDGRSDQTAIECTLVYFGASSSLMPAASRRSPSLPIGAHSDPAAYSDAHNKS